MAELMAAHGPGEAHHHPRSPPLHSLEQQQEASTLGMWLFITEIMFFGGLFRAYMVYRALTPRPSPRQPSPELEDRLILFLDDDDLLIESGLQTHVDAFASHPSAIASVGTVEHFDERGARSSTKLVRRRQERNV